MLITKKTIYKKDGKQWKIENIIDSSIVNILLNDDLIAKHLFKSSMIKSIKYQYGKIYVNYGNNTKAVYE